MPLGNMENSLYGQQESTHRLKCLITPTDPSRPLLVGKQPSQFLPQIPRHAILKVIKVPLQEHKGKTTRRKI